MPTSGQNPFWDDVQRMLDAAMQARQEERIMRMARDWTTSDGRTLCGRCGYDRPANVAECRACSLFKEHAGTVGDAKQWNAASFFRGYKAWLRERRAQDRREVEHFLRSL